MTQELVSVIMPVYKASEEYLKKSIQSILEQDYPHWELIIVEDPSPNTAEPWIRSFRDERIVYVLNRERTGFVGQINKGLALAKGSFVARMDADDIAAKERLGCQINFLSDHPGIHVLGSNLSVIDERGKILGERKYPEQPEAIRNNMRLRNVMAHPTVMLRKNDLTASGGFTEEFDTLADYDLWARMILAGKNFHNIARPLLSYRIHPEASKNRFLKKQLADTLKIKNKYFRFRRGWDAGCELRYWAEYGLRFLPKSWVSGLFLKLCIEKTGDDESQTNIQPI
jgi:glycosyltransferase involved in cell wall biosynthesis